MTTLITESCTIKNSQIIERNKSLIELLNVTELNLKNAYNKRKELKDLKKELAEELQVLKDRKECELYLIEFSTFGGSYSEDLQEQFKVFNKKHNKFLNDVEENSLLINMLTESKANLEEKLNGL